ncbi:PhnA-like protein [Rhizobium sp. P32RR-XVIII]|uniref:PhnA-like protein n=1 Tax=Rhizobium sp. P32RR-XVIII TaxID=2726738 RepID=UPI0014567441|nr:PhnA-like protein [Rhizobium sp. P32RR-XVIII]NLS07759.1 PhnA-like protein [Rhizobium sp. P32RR-XVIII]
MSQPATSRLPRDADYVADPRVTASHHKISWGAIFAGVILALSTQFLLNLLGVGIGAAVLDPATSDNPAASTFSIIGGLWFVAAGIVAAYIGGYVSSQVSGRPDKSTGGFHGVAAWGLTTLVVLYLLTTSVGALVGGAFSGLSSIVGGVGQTAASVASTAAPSIAASTDPMGNIERQIRDASGGNDPRALQNAAMAAMRAVVTGDQSKIDEAKTRAADALAKAQNIPVDQARAKVDEYQKSYSDSVDEAKRQALDAAQTTATVVSRGALLGFVALVLGALAGWFGGVAGIVRSTAVQQHPVARNP